MSSSEVPEAFSSFALSGLSHPSVRSAAREWLTELAEKPGHASLGEVIAECASLRDCAFLNGAALRGGDGGEACFYEEPTRHGLAVLDAILWNRFISVGLGSPVSSFGPFSPSPGISSLSERGGLVALTRPGCVRVLLLHGDLDDLLRFPDLEPYLVPQDPENVEEGCSEAFSRAREHYRSPSSPGFALFLLEFLTGGPAECRPPSRRDADLAQAFADFLSGDDGQRGQGQALDLGGSLPGEVALPWIGDLLT